MDKDIKQEIITKYAVHEGDTGSPVSTKTVRKSLVYSV